jgi:hypothetical protein
MSETTNEASLGRAMTSSELEYLNKAMLDINAFDYKNEPVFDRKYFQTKYPGFSEDVIDILVLYEKGVRFKEFRQLLKKGRVPRQQALVEIKRFKQGVSPFDGSSTSMGV